MSSSPVFELGRDIDVIKIWFKFEGIIPNVLKVIVFQRNHTDDDTDDDDAKPKTIKSFFRKKTVAFTCSKDDTILQIFMHKITQG